MSHSANLPSSGYRYIASVPGIRGGQAIVEGTRIGVHDVITLLQTGESVETVVANCFPTLTRARFEQEAKMAMAVKLFEMRRLSSGMAASLVGMDRVSFLLRLSDFGVPMIDLDTDELAEDIANA